MAFVFRSKKQQIFATKSEEFPFKQYQPSQQSKVEASFKQSLSTPNKKILKGLTFDQTQNQSNRKDNEYGSLQTLSNRLQDQKQNSHQKIKQTYTFSSSVKRNIFENYPNSNHPNEKQDQKIDQILKTEKIQEQSRFPLELKLAPSKLSLTKTSNLSANSQDYQAFNDKKSMKSFNLIKAFENLQKISHKDNILVINSSIQFDQVNAHSSKENKKNHKIFRISSFGKIPKCIKSEKFCEESIIEGVSMNTLMSSFYQKETRKAKQKQAGDEMPTKYKPVIMKEGQSDDEDDYVKDATPGPGSYLISEHSTKKDFRSKKQQFKKIFLSPLERFEKSSIKFHEVTYVNGQQTLPPFQDQSFLSKSPRGYFQKVEQNSPPLGIYETRQSLEHEMVKKLLKSSNSNIFISNQPRMRPIVKNDLPGPCSYILDMNAKAIEEAGKTSYAFKSLVSREFQEASFKERSILERNEQNVKFQADDMENNLIHVKSDLIKEDYIDIQPPPFLSGSERFPTIKLEAAQVDESLVRSGSKNKCWDKKTSFGTSNRQHLKGNVGEGVGIGLYDIEDSKWNKKSYNVLFNSN